MAELPSFRVGQSLGLIHLHESYDLARGGLLVQKSVWAALGGHLRLICPAPQLKANQKPQKPWEVSDLIS